MRPGIAQAIRTFFLVLPFATALLASKFALAQEQDVASKRECAVCHIAEISDFKQTSITPLISYYGLTQDGNGAVNVESTERMCFSCHDGFMLDARSLWSRRANSHPVGVAPSSHISIPMGDGKPILPLNKEGHIFCGTCHSAHGIDWGHQEMGMESPLFLRSSNVESSLCVSCHEERSTGPIDGNHPIHESVDHIPAELVAAGAKFGENQTLICQSCHTPHGAPDKRLLLVENPDSVLCGSCHERRYAHNLVEASQFGTHPVNVIPVKAEISETIKEMGGNVAPDGRIICQSCHKQHLAVPDTHLLIQKNDDSALCRNCHTVEFAIEDSKHDMTQLDPEIVNVRMQTVSQRGVCSSCHLPHGGFGPKMWARNIETNDDPMSHTCLGCHVEDGLAEEHLVGEHSHPVGVKMDESRDDHDGLPTYSEEGVRLENGAPGYVTCASCHDIHQPARDSNGELIASKRSGSHEDRFLRPAAQDTREFCGACHQSNAAVAGTEHDISIQAPRERNIRKQTTKQGGLCSSCHLIHNGNGPVMWARKDIEGEGVAGLCLDCHRKRGIGKKKLVGENDHAIHVDPQSVGLTTTLPLFDAAGEKVAPGRMDCATCHDLHRWSPFENEVPTDDLSDIEGDATNSFLRLPVTDDRGSLCINCHERQRWVAGTDHDLSISAPDFENSMGQSVRESGLCGQCHASHNAVTPLALWALEPGEGQDAMQHLCRSCHVSGASASAKAPTRLDHPQTMVPIVAGPLGPTDRGLPEDSPLPVFTAEGDETKLGLITCPTCHDPHLWNPRLPELGPGAVADDNLFENFLRVDDTTSFYCAACHGLDSLFRYTYFHLEGHEHLHWEELPPPAPDPASQTPDGGARR